MTHGRKILVQTCADLLGKVADMADVIEASDAQLAERDARIAELEARIAELKPAEPPPKNDGA